MTNIAEVLKIVDKYDVADCLPVCSDFLKKNAKIRDLLWVLHLAIQYNLDDLKTFCDQKIRQNPKPVLDQINFVDGQWRVASDKRLSDTDVNSIFPHVFALSKNIISSMSEILDCVPITLAATHIEKTDDVKNSETIRFSLDNTMLLVDVIFSNVYRRIDHGMYGQSFDLTTCSFTMSIGEKLCVISCKTETLYTQNIVIDSNGEGTNRVEIQPPIRIQSKYFYTVTLKSSTSEDSIFTYKAFFPDTPVEFASNACITIQSQGEKCSHSLISQLRFKHAQE